MQGKENNTDSKGQDTVPDGHTVAFSRTEQVQILMLANMNGYNRLFGGKLMEWIDIVAAVVARRHSGKNVTTASVDGLRFAASAHANDTIILVGSITRAWNTSMEVRVETFVENLDGTRLLINRAYFVIVALGEDERPTRVPAVIPQTEDEKREYDEAASRREYRELCRKRGF